MAKSSRGEQLRKDVNQLRKSYTKAMTSANKAAYQGIEKLADHELAAIKKHYEVALKNLKSLRSGGDSKDVAAAQLKLLQDTIDRIMKNARESLQILDATRKQIAADVRRDLAKADSGAAKSTGTARKTSPAKSKAKTKTAGAKTAARSKSTAKPAAKAGTKAKSSAAAGARKTTTQRKKSSPSASSTSQAKTGSSAS